MPNPDDVYDEIRSSDRFEQFVEELAEHFHEDDYKNRRLPEIQASFAEKAQGAGLSEEEAQKVAEKAKGALMRQAGKQAPPNPEDKRGRPESANGPLPEECLDELPGPLYDVLERFKAEENAFKKAHRLIDAIEWAVKWHTVLALSDLLREAEVPDKLKVLLAHGLQTPSLGTWNRFFREAVNTLQAPTAPWGEWERLVDLENEHDLVHFRNRYAHGATPDDEACREDVDRLYPALRQLIGSPLFTEIDLLVAGPDRTLHLSGRERTPDEHDLTPGHAAARLPFGDVLDLWPLGVSADASEENTPAFFFFNALKNKKVDQLNYEIPFQRRDKSLYDAFHERLPLQAWRQADHPDLDAFRQRVAALTESFKGRRQERAHLRRFCREGEGTLMVWGAPGIGKSALLAQVFKEIRGGMSAGGEALEDDFPPVVEYFIRRSEGRDDPVRFLRYLCKKLDRLFELAGHGLGDEVVKLQEQLEARLQAIEESDETPRRMVLFVDGLDEAPEIGRYVPAARSWLTVLCAARDVTETQDFYDGRDRETRQALTVGPLGRADVRALLYEVVNKYDPAFDEDYVGAVVDRSEGNPLYLKLLCEQLFAGDLQVGDAAALPERMDKLYERTLQRVTDGGRAEDALAVLHLLAEAQAALSVPAIAELLDVNAARARAAVDRVMELLHEDAETPDVEDYQLFHESLREWLREHHARGCRDAAATLADRCFAYGELHAPAARRYAQAHAAAHLRQTGDHERLWTLLRDEDYRQAQVSEFNQYEASYRALQAGIDAYIDRDGETPEDDARLAWLTLRAGKLEEETRRNAEIAFEWVENRPLDDLDRIEDALGRIEVLDEYDFFEASLLLLWIEVDRQSQLPEGARSAEGARQVLEAARKRIPAGYGTVDWVFRGDLDMDLMSWLCLHINGVFPDLKIQRLFGHTRKLGWYIEKMGSLIMRDYSEKYVERHITLLGGFEVKDRRLNRPKSAMCEILVSVGLKTAQKGNTQQARSLFYQALDVAGTIAGDRAKSTTLSELSQAVAQIGDRKWAHSLLTQAFDAIGTKTNDRPKSKALVALTTNALQVYDHEHSKHFLNRILGVANSIQSNSDKALAVAAIAKATAEIGDTDRASQLFNEALDAAFSPQDGSNLKLGIISDVVEDLAQAGFYESALQVANKLEDDSLKSRVAEIVAAGNRKKEALQIAKGISSNGSKSEALSKIALNAARRGDVEEAKKLFVQALDASNRSVWTVAETVTQAFSVAEAPKLFARAIDIAQKDWHKESNPKPLARLAQTIAQAGDAVQGEQLLRQALHAAEAIDESNGKRKSTALQTVAYHLASMGELEKARSIFSRSVLLFGQEMRKKWIEKKRSDALREIATVVGEQGNPERALQVAEQTQSKEKRAVALADVALTVAQAGNTERSREILTRALRLADSLESDEESTLRKLAEKLTQVGDIERAFQIVGQARHHEQPRLLKIIALAAAKPGAFERATQIAGKIDELTFKTKKRREQAAKEKSKALKGIVYAVVESGGLSQAKRIVESIEHEPPKAESLSQIAIALAQSGDIEGAVRNIRKIKRVRPVAVASMHLAKICTQRGIADRAQQSHNYSLKVVDNLEDELHRSMFFSDLIPMIAQMGKVEKALQITDILRKDGYYNTYPKSKALAGIAHVLSEEGNTEQAQRVLKKALYAANTISYGPTKANALQNIAQVTTETRNIRSFVQFLETEHLSDRCREKVMRAWRDALMEHLSAPLPLLRDSLRYYSFKSADAYDGVYALHLAHLKAHNRTHHDAITRQCPQLGLDVLLDYERDPDKLPPTLRAKYDTYAELQDDGTLNEEQFTAKVDALFDQLHDNT